MKKASIAFSILICASVLWILFASKYRSVEKNSLPAKDTTIANITVTTGSLLQAGTSSMDSLQPAGSQGAFNSAEEGGELVVTSSKP